MKIGPMNFPQCNLLPIQPCDLWIGRFARRRDKRTVLSLLHVPSLYVFNAAGSAKPHAVEQLAAELSNYDADVALITETHFKVRHTDSVINIPDYTVFCRDRSGRKGGRVALLVRQINHRNNYVDLCRKPTLRNTLGAYWSKHVCCCLIPPTYTNQQLSLTTSKHAERS